MGTHHFLVFAELFLGGIATTAIPVAIVQARGLNRLRDQNKQLGVLVIASTRELVVIEGSRVSPHAASHHSGRAPLQSSKAAVGLSTQAPLDFRS